MQRIRTVKPEVARHEGLFEAERASGLPIRFAWVLLFTVCDREGRFKWRPRALKPLVLPYDEVDFEDVLGTLHRRGFLQRYRVGDEWYGWIPTFTAHQFINGKEPASELPSIDEAEEINRVDPEGYTRGARVTDASPIGREGNRKGTGREGDSSAPPRDAKPSSPVLLTFPTIGSGTKTWDLTEVQVTDWSKAFPGLDILGECRKALAWVQAKQQPKTAKGMPLFLVNWFNRSVQRGGNSRPIAGGSVQPGPAVRTVGSKSFTARQTWPQ
jgi:hypothetical protein